MKIPEFVYAYRSKSNIVAQIACINYYNILHLVVEFEVYLTNLVFLPLSRKGNLGELKWHILSKLPWTPLLGAAVHFHQKRKWGGQKSLIAFLILGKIDSEIIFAFVFACDLIVAAVFVIILDWGL